MQKHPQLLRRPLPPNLPKLSLCQKKVHAVGTGETSLPHVHFVQEKTTSFERDKTSFPVVPRDRAQTPVSIQNLFLDHHVQQRVMTISTTRKSSKQVYWHIPETATGSIFFPRCRSASARVFGKEISKMEGPEKSEGPLKIQNIYASILKDILILSSEFSRVPSATPSAPSPKLKEVHSDHFLQESNIYTFKQPLFRLSATVPIPVPRTPVKARQWSDRVRSRTVTLNITDFPGPMLIPSPVLPRKPLRQSVIESRVTEHEHIETVPKQSMLSLHEGSIKSKKIEPTVAPVIQGEGFKTVVATRYETIVAMTNLAIINCQIHGRNALNLKGFFLLNCPDLTPLAFQLIYLNLSYNNICYFPTEIYCLKHLQILNLRNNPIKEIPSTIQQLKLLKSLNVAFNLITTLPPGSLEKLMVDGNELTSFPHGILKLNLKKILFENNFTNPIFWKENSMNDPQHLTQIAALFFLKNNLHKYYNVIPEEIQKLLKCTSQCEWCHGPMFGEGFRIIRSYDVFGVTQLPVIFYVCSSSCYRKVKESNIVFDHVPEKRISLNPELMNPTVMYESHFKNH
ncbi:leucine-rich repeat-containing protein 63 isoform X3 [Bos indicus x Bos taurus]|uniref:Leucine rich repeat containing 63 n=1 Tax=Bos indicus x Bos taurus TaxID=30522 RepID=A0A4W2IBW8_BOBOX|nr:PREDICTED: leucine-rich repeat-containing protein 63 isoform X3 [Bos indicus]XP_027413017.1 leucine-rich repeat-containing protein 63 isoform X3 [Bos indicus x Bos taurus]